jgi:hydrogenase maturation factor
MDVQGVRRNDFGRNLKRMNSGRMKAGQDLVVAGYAGLAGTCILAKARRQELECRFTADYLDELVRYNKPECQNAFSVAESEPAGEGGILKAIWDLSGDYRLGVEFSLRRIPIRQGTIEICELWGLNPYRLYSDGCWLLATDNGGRLVESLKKQGIVAAVIGIVTPGIARVIVDGGEQSFLNRPQPDELDQWVPDWQKRIAQK